MSRGEKPTANRFAVKTVERIHARKMLTIGVEHPYWVAAAAGKSVKFGSVRDALVRVQPPNGAEREIVDWLRTSLVAGGAAAVRVMPWAKRAEVTPTTRKEEVARKTPREAVMVLATKSRRAGELKTYLEGVLSKVGL